MDFLGKILFPQLQDWQRKKRMKTILVVVVTSVLFASIVASFMLYAAYKK